MMSCVYFQSINRSKTVLFIQLGKVFLFFSPLLWILPHLLDLDGFWLATPTAEFPMFLVLLGLLWKEFVFLKNGITVGEEGNFPASETILTPNDD